MTNNELHGLFNDWKRWCIDADRSEDGWESDFPRWQTLIEVASHTMTQGEISPEIAAILAECWSASQEDEELLTFVREHLNECWATLQVLARSSLPGCRWQVYEAVAGVGRLAEDMLRRGLSDEDAYARRRALLSLARIRPSDAHAIAERFTKDPDPYMRQAAIEMVLASENRAFQQEAMSILRKDLVDHVRRAAEVGWQRIRTV